MSGQVGRRAAFFEQIGQAQVAAVAQAIPQREAKTVTISAVGALSSASAISEVKFSDPLTTPGVGLFAPPAATPGAVSAARSPDAQRQRDMAWLDELAQHVDERLDFRNPEQLRLSWRYTEQINTARTHCETAPLLEVQRHSLQTIVPACDALTSAAVPSL